MFLLLLLFSSIFSIYLCDETNNYNYMEIRFTLRCDLPYKKTEKYDAELRESNKGYEGWFNSDTLMDSRTNLEFGKDHSYLLRGMMHPELDKTLEPYLKFRHSCDMKNINQTRCYQLKKHGNWSDVFPPAHYEEVIISIDQLINCNNITKMASWFGWGGSSTPADSTPSASSSPDVSPELHLFGDDSNQYGGPGGAAATPEPAQMDYSPSPVLALDQLKHAGVPLNRQMTPYLQIDPSMFAASQPQYIMPDGGVTGKGRFEFALGHIGWAVAAGFGVGSMRGALPEMMNPETKTLTGKPWLTRMANATVKHGSGFAQPAGTLVFMYSVLEIGLRQLRADDDLNSIAAGGLSGAIYRTPHGARAMAIGTGVGTAIASVWMLVNEDSRERLFNMFSK